MDTGRGLVVKLACNPKLDFGWRMGERWSGSESNLLAGPSIGNIEL